MPDVAVGDFICVQALFCRRAQLTDEMTHLLIFLPVLSGPGGLTIVRGGTVSVAGTADTPSMGWRHMDRALYLYLQATKPPPASPTSSASPATSITSRSSPAKPPPASPASGASPPTSITLHSSPRSSPAAPYRGRKRQADGPLPIPKVMKSDGSPARQTRSRRNMGERK